MARLDPTGLDKLWDKIKKRTPVVVQSTGGSERAVMSQKATTEAFTQNLSLTVGDDGLVYITFNGAIVGSGVQVGSGGAISGYVDENNNIIVSGSLADGTYTVKYEMDDGSVVEIGNLVLDSNIYYTVTTNLTNCVSSGATYAIGGQSYTATITADTDHELKSVTVTMGGTDITSSAVSGGTVSIDNVTGDIVITAVAEEKAVETKPTNFAGTITVGRLSNSANGNVAADAPEARVTDFVSVANGDIVLISGFSTTVTPYLQVMTFDSSKAKLTNIANVTTGGSDYHTVQSTSATGATIKITGDAAYVRFSGVPVGAEEDIVVNIERNGAWL